MQILQVNSQDITISYVPVKEKLFIWDLIELSEGDLSLIAQVFEIKSFKDGQNMAFLRVLFSVLNNKWVSWRGEAISVGAKLKKVKKQTMISEFDFENAENTINLGFLAQYPAQKVSSSLNNFKTPLAILGDKSENKQTITTNIATELTNNGQKVVILDFIGNIHLENSTKIKAGKDFKLPLSDVGINRIYEKGLDSATPETKAVIEDIFLEVQEYAKNCKSGFIPFSSFKDVVDATYNQLKLTHLVLLKNKLLKFEQNGIFANNEEEITKLWQVLKTENAIIIDLSEIPQEWHKDFIDSIILLNSKEDLKTEFYLAYETNEINSDKNIIEKLGAKSQQNNIKPIFVTSYNFRLIQNILSLIKSFVLFRPIVPDADKIASIFKSTYKLADKEFIICGEFTKNISLKARFTQGIEDPETAEIIEPVAPSIQISTVPLSKEPVPLIAEPIIPNTNSIIQEISQTVAEPEPAIEQIVNREPEIISTFEDDDNFDFLDELSEKSTENAPVAKKEDDFSDLILEYNDEEKTTKETIEELPHYEEIIEYEDDDLTNLFNEEEIIPVETASAEEVPVQDEISSKIDDFLYNGQNIESQQEDFQFEEDDSSVNTIPIYTPVHEANSESSGDFKEGMKVRHQKYGVGTINKIIAYGDKKLCSINFNEVGRRLLDPEIAALEKL